MLSKSIPLILLIRVLFLAARKVPKESRRRRDFPRANAFFGAGRNSPASRCSNHAFGVTALQWAGPAIDAPTWCIKRFALPETTWFSVLFPELVNSDGYKIYKSFLELFWTTITIHFYWTPARGPG